MTYTGDVLIQLDPITNEFDMTWRNGQPDMTNGLETCVLLATFGNKNTVQNAMTNISAERYISTFPDVIRRATVSENTKKDGVEAIKSALAFMVSEKIASSVIVTGQIVSVYGIVWSIEITAPNGNGRYELNWENGSLTFGYSGGGK